MQLLGTPGSPFVRKVRILLLEKGIPHEYVIERPSGPGSRVPQFNPLGKIPVLVRDDGRGLYDSSVIVDYVEGLKAEPKFIPDAFEDRIEVKRWEALGDGVAEATVQIHHEYRKPKEKWGDAAFFEKHRKKIDRGLATMERDLGEREFCHGTQLSLADIGAGYALGYLDYALPDIDWRKDHPNLKRLDARLMQRASFAGTVQTDWKY